MFVHLPCPHSKRTSLCGFLLFFYSWVHSGQNTYFINRTELCSKIILLNGKPKSIKYTSCQRLYLLLDIQGAWEWRMMAFKNGNFLSPITDFSLQLPDSLVSEQKVQVQAGKANEVEEVTLGYLLEKEGAGGKYQQMSCCCWQQEPRLQVFHVLLYLRCLSCFIISWINDSMKLHGDRH